MTSSVSAHRGPMLQEASVSGRSLASHSPNPKITRCLSARRKTLEIVGNNNYKREILSLIPEFKLGLWNAWIIAVLGFILSTIPSLINKEVQKKRMGEFKWSELSKTDKTVMIFTHIIIMPFTIIYSFFLPLKLGTVLFYIGLPISILGILMGFMAGVSFATARAARLFWSDVLSYDNPHRCRFDLDLSKG